MGEANVTLIYRPGPPSDYLARLGASGWCEGGGFSVEEAIEDLARVVREVQPLDQVPAHTLADHARLMAWLNSRASTPILDT